MELKTLFAYACQLACVSFFLVGHHVGIAKHSLVEPDNPPPEDVIISVSTNKKPISPNMYGIFFEEVLVPPTEPLCLPFA